MSGASRLVTGSAVATGSAMGIEVGFKVRKVIVRNVTHPSTFEWTAGMPDDSAFKRAGNGDTSFVASAGITPSQTKNLPLSGSLGGTPSYPLPAQPTQAATTYDGFTLGADALLNQSGDTLYWEAQD